MKKSLLLVVDVQKGFLQTEETRMIVPRINQLVEKWQQKDWPIVYSRFVNLEGSNWEKLRDWHELKQEPDTQLADELKVGSPYIFKKSTYSVWSGDAAQTASIHDAKAVVIVGVDTNECVLATAISVFDAGLTPWLVKDCCASNGGKQAHEAAIKLLKPLLGQQQIITADYILKD